MARKTIHHSFVTEELWEKVNIENKTLLQDFLQYLGSVGRSKETIAQYENDLRIFFVYYLQRCRNKFFVHITKREVVAFQHYLMSDCKMSPARVRRLRSSLSSMSNFIENILDDEFPDFRNIINKIEPPVLTKVREKTILTFEDCERVADELLADGEVQLACYVTVACYSGLRKQELTRLLVKDFKEDIKLALGGNFYKTTPIRVKGRGNRTEEKYVWKKCDKWLQAWLEYRENNRVECEHLFCRKVGDIWKPMTVAAADHYAKKLESYFKCDFYTHSLRHTLCSELVRAGLPLDVPKILLGHSDVSVTQLYSDVPEEEGLEKYNDFFSGKVDKVEKKTLRDV